MNENDSLQIFIEAALDFEKSLTTMTAQMNQLRERFKSYQIKITAGLNQTASAAQIKADLKKINTSKNHVRLVGQMDQAETKKNVVSTAKKLKNTEVRLTGLLDTASTQKNIQGQLQQIPKVEATADVNVDGAEQVDQLSQKMDNAGSSASTMASKVYLARTALQALRRAAREATDTVVELDKAATDLAIVTGSGSDEAYALLKEYNQIAKQLGATTTQISDAATEWLRQGKTAAETTTLIEQSMILSKVGAMDAAAATQNLTSAMKGYKLAVEDVSGIVDKLTAIDLKAAVTASDLAVAMSRTANSANISGVSMERLLGYLATVQEVTQKSAETIGESFKTIFSRMGNIKLGNYLDDDGEDLSDVETVLNSFGIALRGVDGDFRNFADVLDDVYAKWEQFGTIDKRAIANAFAGTRQQENFLVLMENYGKSLEYAGVAADSAGTALEKFSAYEDSIEAKAASFTAAMESLTMDTIDSGLVKDLIDAGTAIVEFVEKTGLLKATLISLGAGGIIKGISLITSGFKSAYNEVQNLGTAINTLRKVDNVGDLADDTIKSLGKLTKGLSDEQLKLVLTSRELSDAQMEAILMASGLSAQEAKQKIQTLGLATSQETATGTTRNLSTAMTGLGASIKAAFAAHPIRTTMTAISAVVTVVSLIESAWQNAKQAAEEARQSMTEAADAANDQRNSLADLIAEYKELATAGDFDYSARETAKRIQEDITDLVGAQADNLDLVNGKLDEEIEKLDEISLQNAKNNRNALDTKKRDAEYRYKNGLDSDAPNTGPYGVVRYFDEIEQALVAIGYENDTFKNLMGPIDFATAVDGNNAQEVLNLYKEIQNVLLNTDNLDFGTLVSSQDVLNALQEQIDYYQEIIDDYYSAQENYLKNEATIKIGEDLKTTDIDTQEAFDEYVQGIQDSSEYSNAYKKILLELINNTFPQFSGAMQQATDSNGDSVSLYTAQLGTLTGVLSKFQSSYDALASAKEDMANGDGLSVETIKALADAEENYLDYLYEENGVVKLNTEAWEENTKAKMSSEIGEIQKEIDSLQDRNRALQDSIKYYEEQQKIFGDDNLYFLNRINEATAEIEANNIAIGESQEKLTIWKSLFDRIANGIKSSNISDALSDIADAANEFGADSNQVKSAMQALSQLAPQATAALYDEETGMYKLGAASEYTAQSILEVTKVNLSASIDAMKAKLAELQASFYATAISARSMYMAMQISDLKSSIADAVAELDLLGSIPVNVGGGGGGSSKTRSDSIKESFDELNSTIEHSIFLQEQYYDRAKENLNSTAMRTSLLNQIAYYKQIQDAAHKAAEELRSYYKSQGLSASAIEAKSDIQSLSETWWKAADSIKEATRKMSEDIVKAFSDTVDSIQDVYDTLHDAADEYAESGFITIDTIQSIINLGQKYVAYLMDENGQLVINEKRIQAVIAARTQQLAIESSLAYVEALRVAKSEGNVETLNDLLNATEQATDATWGLVYANLALAGLDESQYQTALRNINAIRAMADSAVQSIGRTTGSVTEELENMQSGLNDILEYVMDMLKQQVDDQIDALEGMKDAYSEIIDLKRQSMEEDRKATEQQKTIASKLKEIAKLQAQIDALSLDDSREAQAEKAKLMEELADLQEDLADTQADYAQEAQEDALDKMEEAYHREKDEEIAALEESISSYQQLYSMAIAYIESNWNTLYDTLISWNTEYGNVLNSEITTAWDNCLAAAKRYGDYVSALNNIGTDIDSVQNSGSNTVVGDTNYSNSSTAEESIHAIIKEMYANSQRYHTADAAGQEYLSNRNLQLGAMLAQYGVTAVRGRDGAWYVDQVGGELLFDKYRKYIYHDGGIVGGGDIKSNEQLSLLKDKEWVLSEQMVKNLSTQIERVNQLRSAWEPGQSPTFVGKSLIPDLLKLNSGSTINNVTNNSNKPVQITFGDTNIYGADEKTVTQHIEVTRRFANEVFGQLNIKK